MVPLLARRHRGPFSLRIEDAHLGVRRREEQVCSRKEHYVNDVKQGIESDDRGNRGDDAGSSGSPNTGCAALNVQAAIARNCADQDAEKEAFDHPGNNVANEQRIEDKISEINESDIEIGARNKSRRDYSGHTGNT